MNIILNLNTKNDNRWECKLLTFDSNQQIEGNLRVIIKKTLMNFRVLKHQKKVMQNESAILIHVNKIFKLLQ